MKQQDINFVISCVLVAALFLLAAHIEYVFTNL